MHMRAAITLISIAAAGAIWAQESHEGDGARELFYRALVRKDAPPPVHRASVRTDAAGGVEKQSTPGAAASAPAAAVNLGLRYNLVLVDAVSGRSQDVTSDRSFRAGECFAVNFESNRAGFLYVLAKESSGSWHPLVPSPDPDMADESNVITPGQKVRVPLRHCFEIQDPPGVETLFVVLSREPRDSFNLYEGIKHTTPEPAAPSAPPRNQPVQMADAGITNAAVERMRQQFGTRDIAIKRVSQPVGGDEPVGSVYVVNASANPSTNLAAQIEVRHR